MCVSTADLLKSEISCLGSAGVGGCIQNRVAKGEKDRLSIKGTAENIIQISKRSIQRPVAPYGLRGPI